MLIDTGGELKDGLRLVLREDGLTLEGDGLSVRGDFTRMLPRIQKNRIHTELLVKAASLVKAAPADLPERIAHLQSELKAALSENESLKSRLAQGALGDVMGKTIEVKGVKLLATAMEGVDMNRLRDLGDQLKEKLGEGVVVLLSNTGGKVSLITMATEGAQKKGAHAGNLIKALAPIVGGGGGGRPGMAQAGGKDPSRIKEALDAAAGILEGQL